MLTAVASVALLTISGCAALEDDSGAEGGMTVAAGFYPLAWVAEQVAGEGAEVVNLTQPGQGAHDSEPSLAATARASEADLVIVNRGFQPSLEAAVAENASGVVLDVTETVRLKESAEHHDGHDHGHQEEHDHGDHDGHDSHDHGPLDPHFWLDPLLMADLGDAVAEELSTLDPDRASDYEAGAAALREELTEIDAAYTERLGQCERDTVVVSHDAFGYLSRYGLHFEPIAGLSPGAEPTPADLARLQEVIREEGITTVFTETLAPPALAGQLAADMQVATEVLDPIEGLVDSTADQDYLSLMRQNLKTLTQANGC